MYYLNKVIGYLTSPIFIVILGGLAALLCAMMKRKRIAKWIGWISVGCLWFLSMPIATWIVGASLEREFLVGGRVPMIETFPEADVIVSLGGGMGADTNLSSYAEMSAGADRIWQAVRLYKARKATKVIATGFHPQDTALPLLKDFDVAEESVSLLVAKNTEQEAKGIAKMGFKRILLVTSAWHMKRARLMFTKYAPEIKVICAPADFEMSIMTKDMSSLSIILPDVYALQLNTAAIHEWIGILGYKLFR